MVTAQAGRQGGRADRSQGYEPKHVGHYVHNLHTMYLPPLLVIQNRTYDHIHYIPLGRHLYTYLNAAKYR